MKRPRGRPTATVAHPTGDVKVAAYRQLALVTAMLDLLLGRGSRANPRHLKPAQARQAARLAKEFYRRVGVQVSDNSALRALSRGTDDPECQAVRAVEQRYGGPGVGLPMSFYRAARLLNIQGPTVTAADILDWYRVRRPRVAWRDALELAEAFAASGKWQRKNLNM